MSGIVGSLLNHHGSGIIANLGTDGQLLTSQGAGIDAQMEAAAGGGKLVQFVGGSDNTEFQTTTTDVATSGAGMVVAITPTSASNHIFVQFNFHDTIYDSNQNHASGAVEVWKSTDGGSFSEIAGTGNAAANTHGMAQSSTDSSGYILSYSRYCLDLWDTSHNTTTEIIYKMYIGSSDASNNYYATGHNPAGSRTCSAMEVDQS